MEGLAFLQPGQEAPAGQVTARLEDDKVFCAACGGLVTYGRWRIVINGGHEHTVFNPAGVVFTVACYREAVGAADFGDASEVFTWFKGYAWRVSVCAGCGVHLGWRYEAEALPPVFFGLIKDRLRFGPPPAEKG